MRFRPASVAALAAVPLILAGCSQGASPAQPSSKPAPSPPASTAPSPAPESPAPKSPAPDVDAESVAWVNRMCGLVGGFAQAQQHGPGMDKSSAEAFKKSSVVQLDYAAKQAEKTLAGLRGMKSSPIEGGDRIVDIFERGFERVRDVLYSAKAKAAKVDTSSEKAFMSGMRAVQQELRKSRSVDFGAGFEKFNNSAELNAAAARAPECKALTAPPKKPAPPQRPAPPKKPGNPEPQPPR